jgi:ankyrin repeat protein
MSASGMGVYEIAKTLIEHGADIHVKTEYGTTALYQAVNHHWDGNENRLMREGCKKIAALLREHGATQTEEELSRTSIPWESSPEPPVIESPPSIGRPPTEDEFQDIRRAFDFDEIKALIESAPIDVNARDEFGVPLVFRVQSTKMLGLLMDRGADIHTKCDHGTSILHPHSLSLSLDVEVYKMLIQFGADLNACNHVGQTPLIRAAVLGEYELAKILIEHGADIQMRPEHGKTALEEAKDHGYYGVSAWMGKPREGCAKIAQLLREHGAK